jgi:serine protease inhibitor
MWRRVKVRVFLIISLSIVSACLINCSKPAEPQPEGDIGGGDVPEEELAAAEIALTSATTEFGFQLFREITAGAETTENVFISPLSVLNALVMARNGAAGETDRAFAEVLGVEGNSNEALNKTIREVTDRLSHTDADVQFKAANSIWSRAGKALVPEFVALCQDDLNAVARPQSHLICRCYF